MIRRALATAIVLGLLGASSGAAPALQAGNPRVIEIRAERFEFWPAEITVTEGEEVEFRVTSDDTLHGFRIVGAATNLIVPKRGKGFAAGRFTATRAGRYTFECSRMCGAGHTFMCGVLIVRERSK